MAIIKEDIDDKHLIEISKLIEEQMKKLMANSDYGILSKTYNNQNKKIPVLWKNKPKTSEKLTEDMYSISKHKFNYTMEDLMKAQDMNRDYTSFKQQEDTYEAAPVAFNPNHYIDKLSITLK